MPVAFRKAGGATAPRRACEYFSAENNEQMGTKVAMLQFTIINLQI